MSIEAFVEGVVEKFSADIKIAEADAKELEVKARIIALDAYNEGKSKLVDFYESEVARIHADTEKIKVELEAILAKL